MRVLVTGGAGFIGSNLVRVFADSGRYDEIKVIDDLSTGSRSNIDETKLTFIEGSILNSNALSHAIQGVDSVVHLAAIPSVPRSIANPVASHAANITGTLEVLEAARAANVQHVVVASSSSVYGSNPKLPKTEYDWTRPMSPYGVSKLATEGYAIAYQYSYGMKTLAFRFFNVYGPNQPAEHDYAAVVPKFVSAALSGRHVEVHGDGQQSRDFTHVDTVCAVLHEAVVARTHALEPVNLAYGTNTTLLDLLSQLEEILGQRVERRHVPARVGDVRSSQADNSAVRALFPGVNPVSLREGLQSTISWFLDESRGGSDESR